MANVLLETKHLGIQFGGLKAVDDFTVKINEGEIVGLIGPNGAGKTTIFNLLTGVYKPTTGAVLFEGQSLFNMKPSKIVKLGISRTFQNIRLFKQLTVLENVVIACNCRMKYSSLEAVLKLPRYWKEEKEAHEKSMKILKDLGLDKEANTQATNLPYGKQRKLEIARALATEPKLILLDEPAAGMNPTETEELLETVKFIRDKYHVTVLLIEHDMKFVMGICERIVVLNFGKILTVGSPSEVSSNKDVINAYLGSGGNSPGYKERR